MKRSFYSFAIKNYSDVKRKLLEWSATFEVCCFLDNHNYASPYHSYDCLVGVGCKHIFTPEKNFFESLSSFGLKTKDWIFGHLNYDIKNEIENLHSNKPGYTDFPDHCLFVPEVVVQLKVDSISIGVLHSNASTILDDILNKEIPTPRKYTAEFKSRLGKEEYVETINKIKEHIRRGDCYEINYCQEFYAENNYISPVDVYLQLTEASPNPFACFYKVNNKYVLCASPERYLKKTGDTIVSQPIKGTSARDLNNPAKDEINKRFLLESEKDKRENVIVVDLVRNDLSKVCKEGTVVVEELCGIHTFPTVHQLISTVKGKLQPDADFSKIVEATFPMGSMTGAPKKRVLQLIDKYEKTKRGIYSGTIGYIAPDKDFDFNVVIRSIVYDEARGYISYHTGGGITYWSEPEMEYEECLTKAATVFKVLSGE